MTLIQRVNRFGAGPHYQKLLENAAGRRETVAKMARMAPEREREEARRRQEAFDKAVRERHRVVLNEMYGRADALLQPPVTSLGKPVWKRLDALIEGAGLRRVLLKGKSLTDRIATPPIDRVMFPPLSPEDKPITYAEFLLAAFDGIPLPPLPSPDTFDYSDFKYAPISNSNYDITSGDYNTEDVSRMLTLDEAGRLNFLRHDAIELLTPEVLFLKGPYERPVSSCKPIHELDEEFGLNDPDWSSRLRLLNKGLVDRDYTSRRGFYIGITDDDLTRHFIQAGDLGVVLLKKLRQRVESQAAEQHSTPVEA